ncbi:hypothetical protein OUZ56_029776 [Daphnia magna]|uniref:Uncharacterized protein n=1 Tax=Daphnia magna TaxID=35525 RepID=A0ABR0B7T5_9CRUS|nr:hypothetical protein OUZ56_029776 [Daphnia magna]
MRWKVGLLCVHPLMENQLLHDDFANTRDSRTLALATVKSLKIRQVQSCHSLHHVKACLLLSLSSSKRSLRLIFVESGDSDVAPDCLPVSNFYGNNTSYDCASPDT